MNLLYYYLVSTVGVLRIPSVKMNM